MSVCKFRLTLKGLKPSVTRTVAAPSDISFLDLHLIMQAVTGWADSKSHVFHAGDKKIGPGGFEVSEEADEFLESYMDSKISYDYGGYSVDLMFLKGKVPDTAVPVILESAESFPPEECKDLDDFMDYLKVMEDPNDPAYPDVSRWLASVEKSQDVEDINRDFKEHWERIGHISGRVPFNVGATIGALLITGCDGYYYDTEKRSLTDESDGSERYVPVSLGEDSLIDTLASMYADQVGLESDNLLEDLLDDQYRQGWEDYAENFLDEITDAWADAHNFIVEPYGDSDISKMMDLFDKENE